MTIIIKTSWVILLGSSLLCTSTLSQAEWVEWALQPTVEFRNESNLNRSGSSAHEKRGSALRLAVEGGRYFQMSDLTRLKLSVDLEAEDYDKFDLLNNVSFSGKASVVHKFGMGWRAGWISPYAIFGYTDVKDDIRSGNFGNLGIIAGKRLTDRFDVSASLDFNKSEGDPGRQIVPFISSDVFDQEHWTATIEGNYLLSNRLILLGSLGLISGDFIAACYSGGVKKVLESEHLRAITEDAVFGDCVYRFDGNGNNASLDLSYATSRHSSLNIGAEYMSARAGSLDYKNTLFRASFIYSY